jgi:hypothetical protein
MTSKSIDIKMRQREKVYVLCSFGRSAADVTELINANKNEEMIQTKKEILQCMDL